MAPPPVAASTPLKADHALPPAYAWRQPWERCARRANGIWRHTQGGCAGPTRPVGRRPRPGAAQRAGRPSGRAPPEESGGGHPGHARSGQWLVCAATGAVAGVAGAVPRQCRPDPAPPGPGEGALCSWPVCRRRGGGLAVGPLGPGALVATTPRPRTPEARPPTRRGPHRPRRPDLAGGPRGPRGASWAVHSGGLTALPLCPGPRGSAPGHAAPHN